MKENSLKSKIGWPEILSVNKEKKDIPRNSVHLGLSKWNFLTFPSWLLSLSASQRKCAQLDVRGGGILCTLTAGPSPPLPGISQLRRDEEMEEEIFKGGQRRLL